MAMDYNKNFKIAVAKAAEITKKYSTVIICNKKKLKKVKKTSA